MLSRTAAVTALLVFACGKPIPGPNDSGSGGSGGSGTSPCPANTPSGGGACNRVGLRCEYGADIRPQCRTTAECTAGGWQVVAPSCVPLPTVTCPATRDAANGQTCTPVDAYCDYAGQLCHCTNCVQYPVQTCSGPLKWACVDPAPEPQCPAAPARLGAACSSAGTTCTYACDLGRQCDNGAWQAWAPPGGCPRSSQQFKQEIRYLDEAEREALSRRVLSTRLQYLEPDPSGSRRLGFSFEGQADRFSVSADQRHVDLYGYVSEVLATVQSQQAQIEQLRREVERLKASSPSSR